MPEFLENQANIHNSNAETVPLEEPLGIKKPLLSANPLGQNFLSAQFILPLGAKPINLINWSLISPNETAVQGFIDQDLWQDSSFAEFQPLHQNLPPSGTANFSSPTAPTIPPSTAAPSQPATPTSHRLEATPSKPHISRKKATSHSHLFLQKSDIASERKQKDEAAQSSEELAQVPEVQTAVNSEENSASYDSQIQSISPEVPPQTFAGNTTDIIENIPQKREFLSRFISDVRSPEILQQNQESFGALSQESPDSPTLNPADPKSVGRSYREVNIQRKETITHNQGSETVNLSKFDPSLRNDSNTGLTSQNLDYPVEKESLLPIEVGDTQIFRSPNEPSSGSDAALENPVSEAAPAAIESVPILEPQTSNVNASNFQPPISATSDKVAATKSDKKPEVSSTFPPAIANAPNVQKSQEALVSPPLKSLKQPIQPPRTRLASLRESLQLSQDPIPPTSEAIESQQLSSELVQPASELLTATSEAVQSKIEQEAEVSTPIIEPEVQMLRYPSTGEILAAKGEALPIESTVPIQPLTSISKAGDRNPQFPTNSEALISNLQKQVEPQTEPFLPLEPLIPASDRLGDISTFTNQSEAPAPPLQKQENLQAEISSSTEPVASTSESKTEFYPAITQPKTPAANLQKSDFPMESPSQLQLVKSANETTPHVQKREATEIESFSDVQPLPLTSEGDTTPLTLKPLYNSQEASASEVQRSPELPAVATELPTSDVKPETSSEIAFREVAATPVNRDNVAANPAQILAINENNLSEARESQVQKTLEIATTQESETSEKPNFTQAILPEKSIDSGSGLESQSLIQKASATPEVVAATLPKNEIISRVLDEPAPLVQTAENTSHETSETTSNSEPLTVSALEPNLFQPTSDSLNKLPPTLATNQPLSSAIQRTEASTDLEANSEPLSGGSIEPKDSLSANNYPINELPANSVNNNERSESAIQRTEVTMERLAETKGESAAIEPSAIASASPEFFSQTSANFSKSEPLKGVSGNRVESSDSNAVQLTSSTLTNVEAGTEVISPPLAASAINSPDVNLAETSATQSQFENPKIQAFLDSSQGSDRAISASSESTLEPTSINSLVDPMLKSEAQPIASVQREAIAPIDAAAGTLSAELSGNIKEVNSSPPANLSPPASLAAETVFSELSGSKPSTIQAAQESNQFLPSSSTESLEHQIVEPNLTSTSAIAAQSKAEAATKQSFTSDQSVTIIAEKSEQPVSSREVAQLEPQPDQISAPQEAERRGEKPQQNSEGTLEEQLPQAARSLVSSVPPPVQRDSHQQESQPDIALKESSEFERSQSPGTQIPKIQSKAGRMPTPQELLETSNEPANAENVPATPEVLLSSTSEGQVFHETRSPLPNQPPIVQRDLEPDSLLSKTTSGEESKGEARSLASNTPQFIQRTSEPPKVEPSLVSEEGSEITRSRIPTQAQFIQRHSEAQPTQPNIISEPQTPTEKHSFHHSKQTFLQPSSTSQPTAISEEKPPTENQTVAQLLSQPGATPQLPAVLENLSHTQPLGIAHPFVQRSELRSGIPLSEDSQILSSEENTPSFNPPPNSIFSPINNNYKADIFSANNLGRSNPIIQRKVSQSSAQDVPDSWSSVEELLGGTSSPASEPTMVQTFSSEELPTAETEQKNEQQQRQQISDIRTSALLPPGVYMGATSTHSLNFQQQPNSIRELMEKTLQSRAKLEEESASQTAEIPQQIPMSSIAGVLANNLPTISSIDKAAEKEPEKKQTDRVEALAREIYSLLRQRLEIEKERYGSYYSHRLL